MSSPPRYATTHMPNLRLPDCWCRWSPTQAAAAVSLLDAFSLAIWEAFGIQLIDHIYGPPHDPDIRMQLRLPFPPHFFSSAA